MFIVDLSCENGHRFEGWYDSSTEFAQIRDANQLSCPLCQTTQVEQWLSTGSIRTTKMNPAQSTTSPTNPDGFPNTHEGREQMPLETQQALSQLIRFVQRTHEDVGHRFYDEALAIHEGRSPTKAICGHLTRTEEDELAVKGVPVLKIPIPDIENN
jgi:hypothetical protein